MTQLASFSYRGRSGVGIVEDGLLHPLADATRLTGVIGRSDRQLWSSVDNEVSALKLSEVTLCPPIREPVRNIFCVGWNYVAHFEEGRHSRPHLELPQRPTLFSKATGTLAGPYEDLPAHRGLTEQLDWEVEVAVVIGVGGRNIPEETALEHIFGYTVANDVSARNLQAEYGGQWLKGKSLDRTCPTGPVLVTAEQLPDPQQLDITCRVNGRTVQSANTRQMIFPVARIIAELSAGLTLLPGDVVLTGTPEGVGHQRTPPEYLQPGDVLESEVEGIGTMRNVIV